MIMRIYLAMMIRRTHKATTSAPSGILDEKNLLGSGDQTNSLELLEYGGELAWPLLMMIRRI